MSYLSLINSYLLLSKNPKGKKHVFYISFFKFSFLLSRFSLNSQFIMGSHSSQVKMEKFLKFLCYMHLIKFGNYVLDIVYLKILLIVFKNLALSICLKTSQYSSSCGHQSSLFFFVTSRNLT